MCQAYFWKLCRNFAFFMCHVLRAIFVQFYTAQTLLLRPISQQKRALTPLFKCVYFCSCFLTLDRARQPFCCTNRLSFAPSHRDNMCKLVIRLCHLFLRISGRHRLPCSRLHHLFHIYLSRHWFQC